MKCHIYKSSFLAFVGAILLSFPCSAQEIELSNYRMLFSFNTVKQYDNSRDLEVKFVARNKKNRKDVIPVFDAEIEFFNSMDEKEILLGAAKTSKEGAALLKLPPNHSFLMDSAMPLISMKPAFILSSENELRIYKYGLYLYRISG